jgi:Zn-dependent protease with chaperone function
VIEIEGSWFDGKTSEKSSVKLHIDFDGRYTLRHNLDSVVDNHGNFQSLKISPRLGDAPRRVEFESRAVFETLDNAAVDNLVAHFDQNRFYLWLHKLEGHWLAVISSVAITVVLTWSFIVYGVPKIANTFAKAVPLEFLSASDRQTLAVLDKLYFEPSVIDNEQRIKLREQLLTDLPELDIKVHVEFRAGGELGANAFVLPGGTVLFTDEMLGLAENTEQLQAVFGHEIGHLVERHSLRRIAQNSIVSFLALLITGDATAMSDLLTAVPFLLTDMMYSRQFELEADDYAWDYLVERSISPNHYSELMSRLECFQRSEKDKNIDIDTFNQCLLNQDWRNEAEDEKWGYYLLSHPPSIERINRFLEEE